ncbi:MAG: peptide chain release factor N(5)-glutamine methyltransferase [Dehalococcoidales bacterium]|nr:peptide chain release factor N(5)-glutamine methyltransferase [Dehalococcoidales bacterium]
MTLQQLLGEARAVLTAGNIEYPAIEAEMLLRHALKIDRVRLYQELNVDTVPGQAALFRQLIARRLKGEPSAYITGNREFFGLDFHVDGRVLIPRPETELLVEKAISIASARPISTIADIGTGSGAIAVSLATRLPKANIYATDISEQALEVARCNARRHHVTGSITFIQGDLLDPLPEAVDLIIANLPYVRECDLPQNGFEPGLALDGGRDGLAQICPLCRQASFKLKPCGSLLLEIGLGQDKALVNFLQGLFPEAQIEVFPDLAGIPRIVILNLTPESLTAKLDLVLSDSTKR